MTKESFDPVILEENAKKLWQGLFEVNPSAKNKFYLTVAYPYPSGAMHVGHGRTYIVPDVIARYYRMLGYEVLYPMAFHVTGAPVIGISKRIMNGDEKAIQLYKNLYKVPEDELKRFKEPLAIVRYFSDEYARVMASCGLSIDWRRKFTTVDPQYSRFIEWQWLHLKEAGHVVKGAHPVRYCPQCDNPVGDHDLLEGEKAEIFRFSLVMFKWNDSFIPTATLRPETIYGVTNIWVNPDTTYVKVTVDGAKWIVSREAAVKLSYQDHEVSIEGEIKGSSLVDSIVSHPLCGEVPILPAVFVDPDMATGIVMSVPAHAPFDYIALRDLQDEGKYLSIVPKSLITVEGYGFVPAKDAVVRAGIKDQRDPKVDSLTQELYNAEFSKGTLYPEFGGKPVKIARDDVALLMKEEYHSVTMFEFDIRQIFCRCGSNVVIKILHDQWFLQYSDTEWKNEVKEQLARMEIVPPEVRTEFERTIDWLKDWACTRKIGLGTKLPWDPRWLIEPLSDSTIYMAYYTIAHHLRQIPPDDLTPQVFDYIFLGKEPGKLPGDHDFKSIRDEFLYWYPYNIRFSAKDLISNHLTFQIFHHVSIFPENLLPKGMVVFGMGLLNGAKMSSSKGNVFLLEDAVKEFGADTVRMFLVGSAEPWQDFDWRNELVLSTRKQIERLWNTIMDALEMTDEPNPIDDWLMSRLQYRIERTTEFYNNFQTRQALQEAYFGLENDLKWYKRRKGGSPVLNEYISVWIRLLTPIIPFTAEGLWKAISGEGPVVYADWPNYNANKVNKKSEVAEELLLRTVEDVESILKLIQITPKSITICITPDWKWKVFTLIAGLEDKRNAIKSIMEIPDMKMRGKEIVDVVKACTNHIHRLPPGLVSDILTNIPEEMRIFNEAKKFLEEEFGVPVIITGADECTHTKSAGAIPYKPVIIIE